MSRDGIARDVLDRPRFTAGDIERVAGLTSKNLFDWRTKRAAPGARSKSSGWRRFSARDALTLLIGAELRNRFGVPIDGLRRLRSFMERPGADHLAYAAQMAMSDEMVLLFTDLQTTFIVDGDTEVLEVMRAALASGKPGSGLVLNLTPLVRRVIEVLQTPDGGGRSR